MPSPTSPIAYSPETREFCFGIESAAAGTAATVITHEVAEDVTIKFMDSRYQSAGFRKAAATRGRSYRTQRYVEVDVKVCARSAGFAAFSLGALQGNGSEGAVTGTTPKVHTWTPAAGNNRCNTFTLWFDLGDHGHVMQILRATVASWVVTANPDGG